MCAPDGIRTHAGAGLNRLPLPLGYGGRRVQPGSAAILVVHPPSSELSGARAVVRVATALDRLLTGLVLRQESVTAFRRPAECASGSEGGRGLRWRFVSRSPPWPRAESAPAARR